MTIIPWYKRATWKANCDDTAHAVDPKFQGPGVTGTLAYCEVSLVYCEEKDPRECWDVCPVCRRKI